MEWVAEMSDSTAPRCIELRRRLLSFTDLSTVGVAAGALEPSTGRESRSIGAGITGPTAGKLVAEAPVIMYKQHISDRSRYQSKNAKLCRVFPSFAGRAQLN